MDLRLHPKQSEVVLSEATEILYGGAAGGGKSHCMRAIAIMVAMQVPGAQIYLFRRESVDLIKNHLYGPTGFLSLLHELIQGGWVSWNGQERTLKWWNGSVVWLCHCQYEKDVYAYQGAEIHLLLIDELTHFTPFQYRFLRGRVRMPDMDDVPEPWATRLPLIVSGTNPGGASHNFVKHEFVDPHPAGVIFDAPEDEGGMRRQFIPALLTDNPSIKDPREYAQRLAGLGNPELVKAMLEGRWDIVAGGMFDDIWRPSRHVLPAFEVPPSWRLTRSLDWGEAKPFSVGWWAIADGSEARLPGGQIFAPPPRSLIRVAEFYGWNGKPNEGCRMLAKDCAREIKRMEAELWPGRRVEPGPADNSIWSPQDGRDIAAEMAAVGIRWRKSNKTPGSRINGASLVRARLTASGADRPEEPGLWVTETCRQFIRTIPTLPRDPKKPDDVDTNAEDHAYDEVRYMCLDDKQPAQAVAWFGQ
jgi:hypothetical protein